MRDEATELTVRVNGSDVRLPLGATIDHVLRRLEQDPRLVAVECGGRIVPRAEYATTELAPGARVEIVRFVQGG